MKDNLSLIAAAAGGFMLFVALTGILRGAPLVSWQTHSSFYPQDTAREQAHAISSHQETSWHAINSLNN